MLHTIKSGWSIVLGFNFQKYCFSLSEFLKINFFLANSVDLDENASLCSISSGFVLFGKIPIESFLVYNGLKRGHLFLTNFKYV